MKVDSKKKNKSLKKNKSKKTSEEENNEEEFVPVVEQKPLNDTTAKEDEADDQEMKNGNNHQDDEEREEESILSFVEMGIDDRILLAIIQLGWSDPTPIQETAIPLVLEGRDILAKARTGSGKTGAYAIPVLNKILNMKKLRVAKQTTSALILTPSRELCNQAYKNLQELMIFCQREITVVDISSSQINLQAQKQILATRPDIIVSTPTKILAHLKDENQTYANELKSTLELLVIDEADLLLSFGYEEEMKTLVK
jgi:ATP-dependent RNA helicase DDX56/DBP9